MRKVLVAPLDWGLGHATRCIPIINDLLSRNNEIMLAGSGASLQLLKKEFPSIVAHVLPAYNPEYPADGGSMVWKMARQLPKFINVIRKEHDVLEQLVKELGIDLVISDNRYGCWSSEVPSIFITHQCNIRMPMRFGWLRSFIRTMSSRAINQFTECWIPDTPNHSLSGDLSATSGLHVKIPCRYIGPLSRFKKGDGVEPMYHVLAIFSGPEPQRTILENLVLPQLRSSRLKYFVVRGLPQSEKRIEGNVVDHLPAELLQRVIEQSALVISRCGYSTVMDLAALHKHAVFIPTPGQTEQEYLAIRLKEKKIAFSLPQHLFNLDDALQASKTYTGFTHHESQNLLSATLDMFLEGHAWWNK